MFRLLLLLFAAIPVSASVITVTIPLYDGPITGLNDIYPKSPALVGTFNYVLPTGETIVTAAVTGTLGNYSNGFINTTAPVDLFTGGTVKIASCTATDLCDTTAPQPFTFNYSPSQFSTLLTGSLALTQIQNGPTQVHLGQSTLTITTAPIATPEPATFAITGYFAAMVLITSQLKRVNR